MTTAPTKKSARKPRASKRAATTKKAPPPHDRCFFFSSSSNAFESAKKAIERRFEVLASSEDSVSFRWRYTKVETGPSFTLERSDRAASTRSMRAWQKETTGKYQAPPFVSILVLSFDNLQEVLDETNGLIEAQNVISKATRGPMFLAWNKSLVSPEGEDLKGTWVQQAFRARSNFKRK